MTDEKIKAIAKECVEAYRKTEGIELIELAETAIRMARGELAEEKKPDLVPPRPWRIQRDWNWIRIMSGTTSVLGDSVPANLLAKYNLIVSAVNAYKAQETCGTCQGKKAVDSGGVTPWGSEILVPCPECADAPKDLIPPTPWRWEAKGDWITMLNAKGGLVFGLPLPPSQREQLQHLFACIAFSVNKCNTEANSEAIDVSHGIIQIPATPELEGWQPLTMNNHPPFGVEAEFQTRHDAYQRPYIPPRWLSMKLNDIHDLTEAIAVGWHHWRVPKTDEAKGQP